MAYINGTAGNDTLYGTGTNDSIFGQGGNDVIDGDAGADAIDGGVGNDYVNGGDGDDFLRGQEGDDTVVGGAGNDTISGGPGNDVLGGEDGNDVISDTEGVHDQIFGGSGDDSISFQRTGNDAQGGFRHWIVAGDGNDSVLYRNGAGHNVDMDLGSGNDTLTLGSGFGRFGDTQVFLGTGQDIVNFDVSPTLMVTYDAAGNIVPVIGSNGYAYTSSHLDIKDFAAGNMGDTVVLTQTGMRSFSESFRNWEGDNPFASGHLRLVQDGDDVLVQYSLDGGTAPYLVFMTLRGASVGDLTALNFGGWAPDGSAPAGTTINGTSIYDDLFGTIGNDVINGYGSYDNLYGGAGDDRLNGGSGVDRLDGGNGGDTMVGGLGNDTYIVDNIRDRVSETSATGGGIDIVDASINYRLTANVENLVLTGFSLIGTGNALGNTIWGTGGNDMLSGLAGDDIILASFGDDLLNGGNGDDELDGNWGDDLIFGGVGNDTLFGGWGTDRLEGGTGADTLIGDWGADILAGGAGQDVLSGGGDADSFLFREGDTGTGTGGRDRISDYNVAQGDSINLVGIDANALVAGNQVFAYIGDTAFGNIAGQLRAYVDGGSTIIEGDMNGDGVADMQIELTGYSAGTGLFIIM